MVRTRLWLLTPMALAIMASAPSAQGTLLLRDPGIGPDSVAFVYAGDIWLAPLSGGEARRLTSAAGDEWSPRISPDGEWVAFSGQYDGNTDVYVVPISGGEPGRLTYHPSGDGVRGWTPDGSRHPLRVGAGRGRSLSDYPTVDDCPERGGRRAPPDDAGPHGLFLAPP